MGCGCVADPIHTPLPTQVSMPHRTSALRMLSHTDAQKNVWVDRLGVPAVTNVNVNVNVNRGFL